MGNYRHSLDEVLIVLRKSATKKEAYEALGISKNSFYRYLRIMRDKGMLDKDYNIIYQRMDYTDDKFKTTNLVLPDIELKTFEDEDNVGFGGKPYIKLQNSTEYEEYARKRRAMSFEELFGGFFGMR